MRLKIGLNPGTFPPCGVRSLTGPANTLIINKF